MSSSTSMVQTVKTALTNVMPAAVPTVTVLTVIQLMRCRTMALVDVLKATTSVLILVLRRLPHAQPVNTTMVLIIVLLAEMGA